MRIAQIAPLMESVPPRLYGGTERIVSYLTEELVRLGHDVTLFASGDSITSAELAGCAVTALRLDPAVQGSDPPLHADARPGARAGGRVRHPAFSYRPVPVSRCSAPGGSHGHHPARPPGPARSARRSISDSATCPWCRSRMRSASRCRMRNSSAPCITASRSTCTSRCIEPRGGYLAFLGRISPEKRPDRAIRIARAARHSAQDRRQGRQGRRGLFPGRDRARCCSSRASSSSARSTSGRSRNFSGKRGAAVSHRLAGAVRPRHDRGDGVRHAGARVPLRLGARGDRRGRHRPHRRQRRGGGRRVARGNPGARSARGAAALRGAVHRRADGEGLCAVYRACRQRRSIVEFSKSSVAYRFNWNTSANMA